MLTFMEIFAGEDALALILVAFLCLLLVFDQWKKQKRAQEKTEVARKSESRNYTAYATLCQRAFRAKVRDEPSVDTNELGISDFDRIILPYAIKKISVSKEGIFCKCKSAKKCPGFDPIPVKPFPLAPGTNDIVHCQRFIPKDVLEGLGGWEGLRNYAINYRR